ncbi:phage tail fiber protein [Escherichia coli]|nr:phage tail fiber protein [Escherichia coli]
MEVQSVTDGVKVKVSRVPDGVAEYSVWGLKLPTLRQRLFRFVSIRENDDGTYAITAVQHVPEKEAIVDNGAHFDGDQSGTVNGVTPPAVQHLTAEVTADSGEYQVLARWDTPKVVKGVSFLLRLTVAADDGRERLVSTARTTETTYRFTQLALGNYRLTVRAVNAWGQQGDPASVSFRIAAPAAPSRIELTPGYFQITATPHLAVYDPTVQFEFWFSEKRIADIRQVETSARYLGTALYWIVQLSSATNSTSESQAATPKAVKAAYDLANGKYTAQDATTAQKGIIQLSSATNSTSETLAATPKAVKAANDNAEKRLQKDQNGADIPGKDTFTKNIGACRAFGGSVSTTTGNWTTAQFIEWLDSQGAFNHPYWMCKGSWSYGNNKIITDTDCGNIHLAGAVIEVMGIKSAMTIRITTPTTSTGGGTTNAQFTYINHGTDYSPGWRRDYNSRNKPTASEIGALPSGGTAVSSVNLASKGRVLLNRVDTSTAQDIEWPALP